MAIPDFQSLMLPLLRALGDGKDHRARDVISKLASEFELTDAELGEMLPSGRAPVFANRVHWARMFLKAAGLVENPARGVFRITARGKTELGHPPARIDIRYLYKFAEFAEWRRRSTTGQEPEAAAADAPHLDPSNNQAQLPLPSASPEESMDAAYKTINGALVGELLDALAVMPPRRFEDLVVQLLLKMGYGGNRAEAGKAVGGSGDGGIDGVINEDRLGLDAIYVQAKRWKGGVGEPEVRNFLGALVGRGASKGVFITTGSYSEQARAFAQRSIQQKIVLIDGERLANLMIEHGLGVTTVATYDIRRLDSDFFAEE
jgi:restriction system protein